MEHANHAISITRCTHGKGIRTTIASLLIALGAPGILLLRNLQSCIIQHVRTRNRFGCSHPRTENSPQGILFELTGDTPQQLSRLALMPEISDAHSNPNMGLQGASPLWYQTCCQATNTNMQIFRYAEFWHDEQSQLQLI